jgi:hypothetical protein
LRTWLLVEAGDEARRVLASLETYEVVARHGPRVGRAWQIASVFTEPGLRRRGHATRLIELVARLLGAEPRALAMTLYSDVGSAIYERVGFGARPAFDWCLPTAREHGSQVARVDGDAAVAAVLGAHPPRGRFAVVPSFEQIGWHRARERIYADALGRAPLRNGVLSCEGGHALLSGDFKNNRALVLAWWAEDGASATRLCAAALDEAAQAGLPELRAWAPPDETEDDPFAATLPWLGAERRPRDGSLPMLRALPRAPGLVPEAWRDIPRGLWV